MREARQLVEGYLLAQLGIRTPEVPTAFESVQEGLEALT